MTHLIQGPPPLDCHAHVDTSVTQAQIRALDGAHILAVTRTVDDAERAMRRRDETLIWGLGVHPGRREARTRWNSEQFAKLMPHFALIGEIGLDRRAGDLTTQQHILDEILDLAAEQHVLLSFHSAGATQEVVERLARGRHPGAILHWFLGTPEEIQSASDAGAYFSVNAGMSLENLEALPPTRVLTETDFPARATRASRPGDINAVERKLGSIWGLSTGQVRQNVWRNFRMLAEAARVLDRLPDTIGELLLDL